MASNHNDHTPLTRASPICPRVCDIGTHFPPSHTIDRPSPPMRADDPVQVMSRDSPVNQAAGGNATGARQQSRRTHGLAFLPCTHI